MSCVSSPLCETADIGTEGAAGYRSERRVTLVLGSRRIVASRERGAAVREHLVVVSELGPGLSGVTRLPCGLGAARVGPVSSGRRRLRRSGPRRPGTDRPAGHGKADQGLDPLHAMQFRPSSAPRQSRVVSPTASAE
jgi:hypothetical protein